MPRILAALRNVAIGLTRRAGQTNIVAATRHLAHRHDRVIALLDHETITPVTPRSRTN